MDPDAEVTFEFVPVIRQYKSGRVERLLPVNPVPPSVDAATGVASKDVTVDPATGLWARLYLPGAADLSVGTGGDGDGGRRRLPIVLYFHGGGLVAGSAADAPEHAFVNRLAARAGALAVSVEYRLAPEHPVPACYDDAWAALRWVVTAAAAADPDPWVLDHGDVARVFVLGFSVGGNLAHNLTLRAGSEPDDILAPAGARVQGMALLHPFFLSPAPAPAAEYAWLRGKLAELWAFACGGRATAGPGPDDDPRVNPLADGAPSLRRLGCGRVLVCLAEEALAAEGKAYYDGLLASGWAAADAELLDSAPGDHEFHLREPDSAKAVLLMDRLVALITGNL